MTEPDLCHTCGSRVKIRRVPVTGSEAVGDPRPGAIDLRVCTNPKCDSNGPDKAVGDLV